MQTAAKTNVTKTSEKPVSATPKNTSSTTNTKSINNTTSSNNTTAPVASEATKTVSNTQTITPKVQVQNTSATTKNIANTSSNNSTNTTNSNNSVTTTAKVNSEPGVIELVNYNPNAMLYPSNIMVKNTTGKAVPDNILLDSIKTWILQY